MDKQYRIIRLLSENVKKLRAVDVTPQRNVQVVTGKNANGKSSLLDSIAFALGGKREMPSVPLRRGAEDGQVLCVLGDSDGNPQLLVKRTFSASGKTTLEITSAEGYHAPTPQAILDTLCSHVAFDPTSFVRMEPSKQFSTLRELVGIDCSELDAERKRLFDERTSLNRDAKSLAAQADGIVVSPDTPENEVSIAALLAEQKIRQDHNRKNQVERDRVELMEADARAATQYVLQCEQRIAEIAESLEQAKGKYESAAARATQAQLLVDAQKSTASMLEDSDVDEIQSQIASAEAINVAVAKRKRKDEIAAQAIAVTAASQEITQKIDAIDSEKEKMLSECKWPVEGLSFGDNCVLYNGIPLDQASSAEQLRVSVSIVTALNPSIRIALCRDASLLDPDQLAILTEYAEKNDIQCWLEIVGTDEGPGKIVIEDGCVISGGTPENAEPVTKKRTRTKKADEAPQPPADNDAPF